MSSLIAFDPGLSTGWAVYEGPRLVEFGTIKCTKKDMVPLYLWLADRICDIVVVERYMIRPVSAGGFDHQFNSGETLQVIGAIKAWANMRKATLIEQNSDIKIPAQALLLGTQYKKKANQHSLDAILHGGYYLIKSGTYKKGEIGGLKP